MSTWIYKLIALVGVVAALSVTIKTCRSEREKRLIAEQNTIALASDIERYEDVNGKQVAAIMGLQLDVKSLGQINSDLAKELEATNIKLKNATGAVKIVTEYKYLNSTDTIFLERRGDSVAVLNIDKEWLKLSAEVDIEAWAINPERLRVEVPNTLYFFTSIKTRGWWIFKRKVGVQVDVKNSNPYVQVSQGVYVDLMNK